MLKCETNTPAMAKRIAAAYEAWVNGPASYDLHFEHGEWWILTDDEDGETVTYSVVDAEGGRSVDGFDFELV